MELSEILPRRRLENSANTVWHHATVTRERRERLNGRRGVVLWLTGLSSAGKSTIAHALEEELHRMGCRTFVMDGDNVRHGLCGDLGFSAADRQENIRRIGIAADGGIAVETDSTPPTVSITSPASGSAVSGTITVTASASDNVGVAGVQFQYDGINFGAENATSPYAVAGDTTTVPNGSYTLTAVARDAAGNLTISAPVTVTVSNP